MLSKTNFYFHILVNGEMFLVTFGANFKQGHHPHNPKAKQILYIITVSIANPSERRSAPKIIVIIKAIDQITAVTQYTIFFLPSAS